MSNPTRQDIAEAAEARWKDSGPGNETFIGPDHHDGKFSPLVPGGLPSTKTYANLFPTSSPKFPLEMNDVACESWSTNEIINILRQHWKMLLLTMPGEKINDADFGVGIQRWIFNMMDSPNIAFTNPDYTPSGIPLELPDLSSLIRQQARMYLSSAIRVTNVSLLPSEKDYGAFKITISYDFNNGMWQDTVDILTPIYEELVSREGYTAPEEREVALPYGASPNQFPSSINYT